MKNHYQVVNEQGEVVQDGTNPVKVLKDLLSYLKYGIPLPKDPIFKTKTYRFRKVGTVDAKYQEAIA